MGEYKMGIISKLVIASVGAGIGYGACYVMRETIHPATHSECRGLYDRGLSQMQELGKDVLAIKELAGPTDFKLEYVVSSEQKFKGMVYTDVLTGEQGVITKQIVLGKPSYGFTAVDVSALKSGPVYPIQLEQKIVAAPSVSSSAPSTPVSTAESIPSLLEKKIRKELAE